MFEVYVLVEKKKSMILNVLYVLCLVLTVLFGAGMFLISPLLLSFAALFGTLAWFIGTKCTEFEYSYFDGEMRFTKIKNKSKRKALQRYDMDEAHIIAPLGDRSLSNYENKPGLKVRNLTSGYKDAKVYVLVAKGSDGPELIKFEPDEKFLDAVCIKYAQKVRR